MPFTPWQFETGGPIRAAPTVAAGIVYVTSLDGNLYVVDASTGVRRWAFPTSSGFNSSPTVVDGVVYVGGDRHLYALDVRTGLERWRCRTGDALSSSPAVGKRAVYIGASDCRLIAVDFNGKMRWEFRTEGASLLPGMPPRSEGTESSPAVVDDDAVYFVGVDGAVHAIDAASGRRRWTAPLHVDSRSSVAVHDGTVFVAGSQGDVVALDTKTGAHQWEVRVATTFDYAVPAVAVDTVYVAGRSHSDDPTFPLATTGDLYAFDIGTGKLRWHVTTTSWVEASPAVGGGSVYLATRGSSMAPAVLSAYDAATSTLRWQRPLNFRSSSNSLLPMDGIRSSPTVADGRLYIGTPSGHLCVFDIETGDGTGPPGRPLGERITYKVMSWLANRRSRRNP